MTQTNLEIAGSARFFSSLLGEETYPDKDAIAKFVAKSFDIRWEPIEMSLAAREELGIADEQLHEQHEPIFSGGIPIGSRVVRVLSDGIREVRIRD